MPRWMISLVRMHACRHVLLPLHLQSIATWIYPADCNQALVHESSAAAMQHSSQVVLCMLPS